MAADNYDFTQEFENVYISKQKPAPDPASATMKSRLQCYPPLGQVTQAGAGSQSFTAALEVPARSGPNSWEVALWFCSDGSEWKELALKRPEASHKPQTLQADSSAAASVVYFTGSLPLSNSITFTLKFRSNEDEHSGWRWIRDEQGLDDGFIVATSPASAMVISLRDAIMGLNLEWAVTEHMSQAPRTQLWSLKTIIKKADGDTSTFKDLDIGTPWGTYLR